MSKVFNDSPLYVGDEGLFAALIGTLCTLMDPMVDELDAYEIAKELLDMSDTLDYPLLEMIVGRIKLASVKHEQEIVWN